MLVIDLIAKIRSQNGDEDPANYRFTDNVYRDTKIPVGLDRFNMQQGRQFEITGIGDSAWFNPTPIGTEVTLLCLYTILAILDGDIVKAANLAVAITDPAGRTDTTKISSELREQRKTIKEEINAEIQKTQMEGAVGQSNVSEDSF